MCILRLSHLMAVVPISILLTVSFFVLVTIRKIEEKGLRVFGYVVAGFLWLAALVIFSGAVYRVAQGSVSMKGMMLQKMRMECMSQMMQKNNPLGMVMGMPEKNMPDKEQKRSRMTKCAGNKGIVSKAE